MGDGFLRSLTDPLGPSPAPARSGTSSATLVWLQEPACTPVRSKSEMGTSQGLPSTSGRGFHPRPAGRSARVTHRGGSRRGLGYQVHRSGRTRAEGCARIVENLRGRGVDPNPEIDEAG